MVVSIASKGRIRYSPTGHSVMKEPEDSGKYEGRKGGWGDFGWLAAFAGFGALNLGRFESRDLVLTNRRWKKRKRARPKWCMVNGCRRFSANLSNLFKTILSLYGFVNWIYKWYKCLMTNPCVWPFQQAMNYLLFFGGFGKLPSVVRKNGIAAWWNRNPLHQPELHGPCSF